MAYVLEKITTEARERMTSEVDERFRLRILRLDWWEGGPVHWAIDREHDSYLCLAPNRMGEGTSYSFFFQSKMYHFTIRNESNPIVVWRFSKPNADEIKRLQSALTQAFAVHGFSGHIIGYQSPLVPIFSIEGDKV